MGSEMCIRDRVYNLAGSTLSSLSNLVGLDFVQIERSAVVYL